MSEVDYAKAAVFAADVKAYRDLYASGFIADRLAAYAAEKGYAARLEEGRVASWLADHGWPGPKKGAVLFMMHEGAFLHRARVEVRFVRQHGMVGGWRLRQAARRLKRDLAFKLKVA